MGINQIDECIKWLVDHRPSACPNPVITKFADELLLANGELFKKAEEVASIRLTANLNSDWTTFNRNHLKE